MKVPIYAGMATMPGREDSFSLAKESIIGQVDHLFVYDNAVMPDLTDNGKFWGLTQINEPCIYLTLDDDLMYPPDYVKTCVDALERHEGHIITFHGKRLLGMGRNYYKGHENYRCLGTVDRDVKVHVAGTGVTAFFSSHLDAAKVIESPDRRMSDLVFSQIAAEAGVPIMCIAHQEGWIAHLPIDFEKTIYAQEKNRCERQSAIADYIYSISKWT